MGINSTSKVSPHDCDLMMRNADKPPPAGVAYQLVENDPLVNTTQCELDAALMKQLGANTIRVYHVDSTADHDGCMNAFAAAGIYLFVDMDTVGTYIREVSHVEETYWQVAD
jgi:1,3-beta-glucanosyltransferase GAS1